MSLGHSVGAGGVAALHRRAASWGPLFALRGGDLAYADGLSIDKWTTFLEE